jgi:hypothetical protein
MSVNQYTTCGLTDEEALKIAMDQSIIMANEEKGLRTAMEISLSNFKQSEVICIDDSDEDIKSDKYPLCVVNPHKPDPQRAWRPVTDCPGLSHRVAPRQSDKTRRVLVITTNGDIVEVDEPYPKVDSLPNTSQSIIHPPATIIPPKDTFEEANQLELAIAMSQSEIKYSSTQPVRQAEKISINIVELPGMQFSVATGYVDGSAIVNSNMIFAKDPTIELKNGNLDNGEGPYCFLIAIWHKNKEFFETRVPAIRSPYALLVYLKWAQVPPKPNTMYDRDSIELFAKHFNVAISIDVVRINHMDSVNNIPNPTTILTVTLNIDATHYITGLEC